MPDAIILLLGLAIGWSPNSNSHVQKSDLREVSSLNSLPEVGITNTDRQQLVSTATAALPSQRDGVAASMLLGEIARATVVLPEPLPPNAIVMNCDVEVRYNIKKAIKHLHIVFLARKSVVKHGVSVLTPIGAALVGLSDVASRCTPVGDRSSYTVLRVRITLKIGGPVSKHQHEKVDEHASASCVHWA